jgi:hypothetical protein
MAGAKDPKLRPFQGKITTYRGMGESLIVSQIIREAAATRRNADIIHGDA